MSWKSALEWFPPTPLASWNDRTSFNVLGRVVVYSAYCCLVLAVRSKLHHVFGSGSDLIQYYNVGIGLFFGFYTSFVVAQWWSLRETTGSVSGAILDLFVTLKALCPSEVWASLQRKRLAAKLKLAYFIHFASVLGIEQSSKLNELAVEILGSEKSWLMSAPVGALVCIEDLLASIYKDISGCTRHRLSDADRYMVMSCTQQSVSSIRSNNGKATTILRVRAPVMARRFLRWFVFSYLLVLPWLMSTGSNWRRHAGLAQSLEMGQQRPHAFGQILTGSETADRHRHGHHHDSNGFHNEIHGHHHGHLIEGGSWLRSVRNWLYGDIGSNLLNAVEPGSYSGTIGSEPHATLVGEVPVPLLGVCATLHRMWNMVLRGNLRGLWDDVHSGHMTVLLTCVFVQLSIILWVRVLDGEFSQPYLYFLTHEEKRIDYTFDMDEMWQGTWSVVNQLENGPFPQSNGSESESEAEQAKGRSLHISDSPQRNTQTPVTPASVLSSGGPSSIAHRLLAASRSPARRVLSDMPSRIL